jgi:hypothetical protein
MAFSAFSTVPTLGTYLSQLQVPLPTGGLMAEVFRESNQSQWVSQSARAVNGADAVNQAADSASISQDAEAAYSSTVDIAAAAGAGGGWGLAGPRVAQVSLGSQGAQGTGGFFQSQGGGQVAVAHLYDSEGNRSNAQNSLSLVEGVDTNIGATSGVTVQAPSGFQVLQPTITTVIGGSDVMPSRYMSEVANVPARFAKDAWNIGSESAASPSVPASGAVAVGASAIALAVRPIPSLVFPNGDLAAFSPAVPGASALWQNVFGLAPLLSGSGVIA